MNMLFDYVESVTLCIVSFGKIDMKTTNSYMRFGLIEQVINANLL